MLLMTQQVIQLLIEAGIIKQHLLALRFDVRRTGCHVLFVSTGISSDPDKPKASGCSIVIRCEETVCLQKANCIIASALREELVQKFILLLHQKSNLITLINFRPVTHEVLATRDISRRPKAP